MKKFLLSILTIIYMTVSSGIAMDVHFCMGKQAGADIFPSKVEKCSVCGMKEKKGCCSDEHRFYKIEDAHKSSSNIFDLASIDALVPQPVTWHSKNHLAVALQAHPAFTAPANTGPPLFVRHCVFRL